MSDAPLEAVEAMLSSPIHDHRLSALLVLVERYRRNRKDPSARRKIIDLYLSHTSGINNWDLVDLSAQKFWVNTSAKAASQTCSKPSASPKTYGNSA